MTSYKKTLAIDIETFSGVELGQVGVYKYAESPDFDILLFAYAYDDEPVEIIDLTKETLPQSIIDDLLDPHVLKTAFNAAFERVCINTHLGTKTGPWDCTMVRAWELGISGSLAVVGAKIGIKEEKRKLDGSRLIRTFCKPRKPTKNNPATQWRGEDKPEEWAAFVEYCKRDVEAERAIRNGLLRIPIFDKELDLYRLDQKINDNGILIDVDFCHSAIEISDALTDAKKQRYLDLTGLDNPNSLVQLKDWIFKNTGETVASITKGNLPELIDQFKDFPDIVEALEIRTLLGKTSVAKYNKMIQTCCEDGRSRGNLQFFGAKTGRWAGRLIQLQNLPQNHLADLDTAREVIATGDYELVDMLYPDTTDILRQCIRTAIIPPPGKKFVVADFSAIEARVIAWLAGEQWRLDVFEQGGDIYCASASQMFGVPVEKHGINGHLRQKGKVAELALGYAGSVGALKAMGALKMGVDENELKPIVEKWRKASPKVVQLWHDIENACFNAMDNPGESFIINKFLSVYMHKKLLFIVLPSGRKIGYLKPKVVPDEYGRGKLYYLDTIAGKPGYVETYYGKLTENVVQATARDCLAHALLALDKAGYKIIFHVHDEVIVEVDESDDSALDTVSEIMGRPIQWAPGLPLRADGYECNYYKKD